MPGNTVTWQATLKPYKHQITQTKFFFYLTRLNFAF